MGESNGLGWRGPDGGKQTKRLGVGSFLQGGKQEGEGWDGKKGGRGVLI